MALTQSQKNKIADEEQQKRNEELMQEFKDLKNKIFGNCMFVITDSELENSEEMKRHDQLRAYFIPQFRKSDFVNPY